MKQNWEKQFEKETIILLSDEKECFSKRVEGRKRFRDFISKLIHQAKQEERERIKKNIGQLRQWLNERTEDRLITNEDIETFLNK